MDKEKLLTELKKAFEEIRKDMKLSVTLDDLDDAFFIRDFILQSGFVSPSLSRMICRRMRDTFNLWTGQLHAWVMPNPQSMISFSESKIYDEKDKEEIINTMKKFMAFISQNVVIGLTKDRKREAEYIEEGMKLWKDNQDTLIRFTRKVEAHWKKERDEPKAKKKSLY